MTLLGLFLPGYVKVKDRAPHVLDEGEMENGLDFAAITVPLSYTLGRQEFMEIQQPPDMGTLHIRQESCKQKSSPKMKKFEGDEKGITNKACKGEFLQTTQTVGIIMPAHLDWQLVIPTVIHIPIRAALAPRISRAAPPAYHAPPPAGKIYAAPRLGMRYSTATLPMAAEGCRDGRSAEPNDVPRAAYSAHHEEVKADGL